jgi:DNA-binding CsgD family transcriptional regulator
MLGEGHRVTEIARRLGLSPKTVSTHRARILEKTGMRTNADIVHYVAATDRFD